MNNLWIICMSVLGFLLIFITVINYNNCKKEYKNILQLSQHDNPQTITSVRSNQVYPMPIVYGIRVYGENDNLVTINVSS